MKRRNFLSTALAALFIPRFAPTAQELPEWPQPEQKRLTHCWIGEGSWHDPANWDTKCVPTPEDNVILDGDGGNCHIDNDTYVNSITVGGSFLGTLYLDADLVAAYDVRPLSPGVIPSSDQELVDTTVAQHFC
jgi:hypothetical protein